MWVSDSTDLGTAFQWLELTLVDLDSLHRQVAFCASEQCGWGVCTVSSPWVGLSVRLPLVGALPIGQHCLNHGCGGLDGLAGKST